MTELVRLSSLQRRVVSALHTHGPLARSELTDLLDVSRSRLSPEVAHLVAKKVAREELSTASTGGGRGQPRGVRGGRRGGYRRGRCVAGAVAPRRDGGGTPRRGVRAALGTVADPEGD